MQNLEGGTLDTVLLVDARHPYGEGLNGVLRNFCRVVAASTAEEARALCEQERPRFIVSFVELPWMESGPGKDGIASPFPQLIRVSADDGRPSASQWQSELVARLAGGVAHEFNNLLTVIIGLTQLTAEEFPEGHPRRIAMETVVRTARRAALLARQLLAYSGKQLLQARELGLADLVFKMDDLLLPILGPRIRLVKEPAHQSDRVCVDPGQFELVMVNLAENARDAMPSGGTLTIQTASVELDEEQVRGRPGLQPGPYVRLTFSDTGAGLAPEAREHLFEPFFTTRKCSQHAGLGLAAVAGVVRQAGGHVELRSTAGAGTRVIIHLPDVSRRAMPVQLPAPAPRTSTRPLVLLAEDQDDLRALAAVVLERGGFRVLQAADGEHALELARQTKEPIDLLLTDVVMARMSGQELAARLSHLHPCTKILYMSGYGETSVIRRIASGPTSSFLQKPFSPGELLEKVRAVFAGVTEAPTIED